jgi:hypothetical protein
MRRRIEEQQEAYDILVESCRAAEDKCEVLEGQKKLAEQQVKDANATAFDAQKRMKLVQDQLAKVRCQCGCRGGKMQGYAEVHFRCKVMREGTLDARLCGRVL